MAEPTTAYVVNTEEMHLLAVEIVSQADHVLQRLKLCRLSAEQEEHEFLEDLSRETFF